MKTANKSTKKWISVIILAFAFFFISCKAAPDPSDRSHVQDIAAEPALPSGNSPEMQIHYIDVGQGDSTLILCDGHAMLIDAGNNTKGTAIQLYLQKQGVSRLDYVIATHPDSDHIGGLDVILTKFDCEIIMMPDCTNDTAAYREVLDAMNYRGYQNTLPVAGNSYTLGDAVFTVIAPNSSDYGNNTNNYSIGIKLVHGKNSFIFTGDAEEEAEQDILQNGIDLKADVLKIAHHGSKTASSQAFLEAVAPAYAVISCGEGNSYGHPHAEVLNRLRSMGIQVFRTDEQGSIVATSDGETITFNCAPSESWQAGEPGAVNSSAAQPAEQPPKTEQEIISAPAMEQPDAEEAAYIINTNTGKFHYADCSSVEDMAESNKLPSNLSRDEIIAQGYIPCKRCNP